MKPPAPTLPFDLTDTNTLKGMGILFIVLHNLYHWRDWVRPVWENEFDFDPARIGVFLATVVDPQQTMQSVFSYLGHFGVQLFIFLSAYGLAIKYWELKTSWGSFVWSRVKKIYPMFLLACGLWLFLTAFKQGPAQFLAGLSQYGDDLLLTMAGLITLAPGYGLPPVGPWWFLPFIIQFYCAWPFLAKYARRFGGKGLAYISAIAIAALMLLNPMLVSRWSINLLETPLGHLPELCLGIAMARFQVRIGFATALLAAAIFILGNFYELLWPVTFITALVFLLFCYQSLTKNLRPSKFLQALAVISMPLFFVNGFLRGPFLAIGAHFNRWYMDWVIGLLFLLVASAVAYGLLIVERRITKPVEEVPLARGQGE